MPTPQELTPALIREWIAQATVDDLLGVWDALYDHDELIRAIARRVRERRRVRYPDPTAQPRSAP